MDCPEKSTERGGAEAEAFKAQVEKDCAYCVEKHVGGMVANGIQRPDLVFEPEDGEGDRVIVEGLVLRIPDNVQSIPGADGRVVDEPHVVVPDVGASDGGKKGQDREDEKEDGGA